MKVMILGAGLGTRLRPITDTVPKVMVPIAPNVPLLEHEIRLFKSQGFTEFIINTHYLPEVIMKYFGTGERFGVSIEYSDETQKLLDTAGALKKVEDKLSDDFILVYGDELFAIDFRPIVEFHKKNNAVVTMLLKRSDHPQNGDVIEIDPKTKAMVNIIPRPHEIQEYSGNFYLNGGLYVLSKKILASLPVNTPIHLDKELIPELFSKRQRLYALPVRADILDIGTPEKYASARDWYLQYLKTEGKNLYDK